MTTSQPDGADDVRVSLDSGIMRILINRPRSLNAVDERSAGLIESAIDRAETSPETRVVVLRGAGRSFCSGADLRRSRPAVDEPDELLAAANRIAAKIGQLSKPVVAAVDGVAAGVGVSLALACDMVLAKESAYFLMAFARIGVMPDGGATLLVPSLVGRARAMEMAFLAEKIPSVRAEEWGMIYRSIPDDEFDVALDSLLHRLADGPTLAYAETKRAINANCLSLLDAACRREAVAQTALKKTADAIEGVAAFLEKRPASFIGK